MELTLDEVLQKGIEAHKTGQIQEAGRFYTSILKTHPNHPDANHNMGMLAVSVGKGQKALPFFKAALIAKPSVAQFWLSYVTALIKLGRIADAKAVFDEAKSKGAKGEAFDQLELDLNQRCQTVSLPEVAPLIQEAIDHREAGEFSLAIKLLVNSSNESSKSAELLSLLAHCYILDNDLASASIYLEKAKQIDPQNASVGWNDVRLLLKQKDVSHALVVARKVIERHPDDVEGMGVLGSCLRLCNEVDESLLYLDKAISLNPKYAEALINRGLIKLTQQDKLGALSDLEVAHKLKPYIKQIWDLVISLNIEFELFEQAVLFLAEMVKTAPKNEQRFVSLAFCHQSLGNLNAAIDNYKQGLKLNPDNAEVYVNMGVCLKNKGELKAALDCFKKALSIKPVYVEALINMGNALTDLGSFEQAVATFKQVLLLKPEYAEEYSLASFNIGLILLESGKHEEAAEYFKLSAFELSKHHLLKCLYLQDKRSLFYDQLDYFINQGEVHPMIGSLACRATLRYGMERPNLFCKEPLNYFLKTDLSGQYNFEERFIKTVRTILDETGISNRRQGLLTNGYQTSGDLFSIEPHLTKDIQKIIRLEVEKYLVRFKASGEGLITSWPTDYSLRGWIVAMKSGGKLRPHMHDTGWISGSIYIKVPSRSKADGGNLVICIEEEGLELEGISQRKSIDVVTGDLCLFPASLLHYTIPFDSEEERVVLAFDVVPN